MPDSFQALAVTLLALLPGALYTWAFERHAGAWGVGLSDRLLRFVGASAVFQAAVAPGTYALYRNIVQPGKLSEGSALPWWVWPLVAAYVIVPVVTGSVVGVGTQRRSRWTRWLVGPSPAPRAYDHLFVTGRPNGWVRVRLKEAGWLLGAFGAEADGAAVRSYASGYPEPEELFFVDTAVADEHGNFVLDEAGNVQLRGVGALVRLDEAAYVEWIEG